MQQNESNCPPVIKHGKGEIHRSTLQRDVKGQFHGNDTYVYIYYVCVCAFKFTINIYIYVYIYSFIYIAIFIQYLNGTFPLPCLIAKR